MYRFHLIFFITSWDSLLLPASSDDLFSVNNSDDIIWVPEESTTSQAAVDGFNSEIELMSLGDSDDDQIPFADDDALFLADTASHSLCTATEASDVALKARDRKSSCQTYPEAESPPILSPETLQFFQDSITVLTNSFKEKQGLSSPGQPPNPSDPPLYPEFLPNDKKTDVESDLDAIGPSQSDKPFFCLSQRRIVPVCCDGPLRSPNMLENCDEGKKSVPFPFPPLIKKKTEKGGFIELYIHSDFGIEFSLLTYMCLLVIAPIESNPDGPFYCDKRYAACCVEYVSRADLCCFISHLYMLKETPKHYPRLSPFVFSGSCFRMFRATQLDG